MYFASRAQAGRMLASKITKKYLEQDCAIVALTDGGAVVGLQIARQLRCVLSLLASAEIMLPREPQAIAGITSGGVVAYNHGYSQGEIDELVGEYYGFIENEKLVQMHGLNQLLGSGGTIDKKQLEGKHVIMVSDGLKTGFEVDLASQFLKPVKIAGMIVATPFASVQAVDKMHVLADDLFCLNVIEDYIDTDHYYDKNDVPDHQTVLETVAGIVEKWR